MRYERYIDEKEKEILSNPTAQKILNASIDIFLENGYHAVTLRDIANQTNSNLGLIPYYFKSKENLANYVYKHIADSVKQQIIDIDFSHLNAIEKIYISTILSWHYLDKKEDFSRFFYEFYESAGPAKSPSKEFTDMSYKIISEHNLQVSMAENEIFFNAMMGSEWVLTLKRHKGELNISLEEIVNLLLSNYLYNIGLSDKLIAQTIKNSLDFLEGLK
ncbi:TetR/AcrR family transcriptional regulator [Oceanobacillus sp. J11TS1]|uniref:TetR/AcrR family transcriptional regulator n=1 Tax=Oceanobacillus sp. J11TS1 TaxID=2807191 RepID=UPI001B289617|nr:TetR/AcrR family transcriptional regulator [Oceanobacillus sp. J11TS1]GIO24106.1 TetR family transcriptional regulator [Oceanobacillus sp. J11TS1]